MSTAICFNFDKSRILSFGNGLNQQPKQAKTAKLTKVSPNNPVCKIMDKKNYPLTLYQSTKFWTSPI